MADPYVDDPGWLRADCSRCAALCCVVPAFARSADFAEPKPSGQRCRHLRPDDRCRLHDRLHDAGYPGCVAFDCFGAGQRITATLQGGSPPSPEVLFTVRRLHQLLWLLHRALSHGPSTELRRELSAAFDATRARAEALHAEPPDGALDTLRRSATEIRARFDGPAHDHAGEDLVGADLRHHDLRAANLRGAMLVGARLEGADLSGADLTGADLRGAHLNGADLSRALFLHPSQLASTHGDAQTRIAEPLRPAHW